MEMSAVFDSSDDLRVQESNRIGSQIARWRGIDGTSADVLEDLDDARFNVSL
jgi:hypothetical protein